MTADTQPYPRHTSGYQFEHVHTTDSVILAHAPQAWVRNVVYVMK